MPIQLVDIFHCLLQCLPTRLSYVVLSQLQIFRNVVRIILQRLQEWKQSQSSLWVQNHDVVQLLMWWGQSLYSHSEHKMHWSRSNSTFGNSPQHHTYMQMVDCHEGRTFAIVNAPSSMISLYPISSFRSEELCICRMLRPIIIAPLSWRLFPRKSTSCITVTFLFVVICLQIWLRTQ